jgi:hypothetical protein
MKWNPKAVHEQTFRFRIERNCRKQNMNGQERIELHFHQVFTVSFQDLPTRQWFGRGYAFLDVA